MDPSIMTWNGTRTNSHDDDDLTPHFLSLTSSLAKTGGCSSPCIADESKTLNKDFSPPDNNTMNLPPTTFISSDNDKNNTTNLPPTTCTSPSHRPMTRSVPTLAEMKSYVYNNIPTANNSQPPIFSTDNTAGQLVWGSDDDDSTTEYDKVSSDDDYSIEAACRRVNQANGVHPVLTFCNETHFLNKSSFPADLRNRPMSHYVKPTLTEMKSYIYNNISIANHYQTPISLMIPPRGNWYGGIRMMIQTQITTTITLPNSSKILPRFQATLIRLLAELMIVLSYPLRYIPLLLINALWFFLDRQHHRIIPDTNPSTTISLPTLSHPYPHQLHPTHGIVNVILFANNRWLTTI